MSSLILSEYELLEDGDLDVFEDQSIDFLWIQFPEWEIDGNIIRASGRPKPEYLDPYQRYELGGPLCRLFDEPSKMRPRSYQNRLEETSEWDDLPENCCFSGLDCPENRKYPRYLPVLEYEIPEIEIELKPLKSYQSGVPRNKLLKVKEIRPLTPLLAEWIGHWKGEVEVMLTDFWG